MVKNAGQEDYQDFQTQYSIPDAQYPIFNIGPMVSVAASFLCGFWFIKTFYRVSILLLFHDNQTGKAQLEIVMKMQYCLMNRCEE